MYSKNQQEETKEKKQKFAKKDYSSEAIRCLALAPSQYGKSYIISKWVIQMVEQGKKGWTYERIIIFSPTARSDPSQLMIFQEAKKKNPDWLQTNVYEYIDENVIDFIYETNKKIKENGHHPFPYLLLFDDVLCDEALSQKKSSMSKIATTGRHFCVSSVVSCQIFKGFIQPVVRQQLSMIMIGRINSQEGVEIVLQEYSSGAGKTKKEAMQTMLQLWEEAIQFNDNHGFLVIYPYQQWGSKKRIQIGSPIDGKFVH